MEKKIVVTESGLKALENELVQLKTVRRKEVSDKIRVARSFGDLSENSEYDEAKNEQAKIEARIVELEKTLENVTIIVDAVDTDAVTVGVTVTVFDVEYDEELTYRVVGSAEADPINGLISDDSPVGRALLGAKIGDEVVAEAPAGELKFRILSINK